MLRDAIQNVLLYGGPKDGEMVLVDITKMHVISFACYDPEPVPRTKEEFEAYLNSPPHPSKSLKVARYIIKPLVQRLGFAARRLWLGVIEGFRGDPRVPDAERLIRKIPWEAIWEPSFFNEFDDWFDWACYRATGEEKYLQWQFEVYRRSDRCILDEPRTLTDFEFEQIWQRIEAKANAMLSA